MTTQTAQLLVSINAEPEADTEELERLTRQLREDLLETEVEDVALTRAGEEPERAKVGDPISWGTLLVTLAASGGVLTTLINAIQAWLMRNGQRSVTLEFHGDKIQVSGISSEDQQRLIAAWIKRQTGRR